MSYAWADGNSKVVLVVNVEVNATDRYSVQHPQFFSQGCVGMPRFEFKYRLLFAAFSTSFREVLAWYTTKQVLHVWSGEMAGSLSSPENHHFFACGLKRGSPDKRVRDVIPRFGTVWGLVAAVWRIVALLYDYGNVNTNIYWWVFQFNVDSNVRFLEMQNFYGTCEHIDM